MRLLWNKWLAEISPVMLKSLNDMEQRNELCVKFGADLSKLYADGFHAMIASSIMNVYMKQVEDVK